MDFKEAYNLPIGNNVEKKGKFSYLSWAFAVQHLRENFKDATWEIKENDQGQPLFSMPKGFMVCVTVIVDDCKFPQWHPILDFKNKPIPEPNAFDVNTAIQRCLTKAIGLATGIGLGLYAGEDLPMEEESKPSNVKKSGKSLPDWQQEADKKETMVALNKWVLAHTPQIKQDLGAQDRDKFGSYVKQLRATFEEVKTVESAEEKTVVCPQNKKEIPLKDCVGSSCSKTCQAYEEANL